MDDLEANLLKYGDLEKVLGQPTIAQKGSRYFDLGNNVELNVRSDFKGSLSVSASFYLDGVRRRITGAVGASSLKEALEKAIQAPEAESHPQGREALECALCKVREAADADG
jgi:hypothetical protein